MELVHDFVVPVPEDQAWEVLTDIERIVPCMPGASITSVEGDAFKGGMKIKLGPIGMTFTGQGAFVQKNDAEKSAVIEAKGRDGKGNGGAQATVTAELTGNGSSTAVHVVTDLNVTGKAAQFGSGVMKDVSNRLLAQFADNLATQLGGGSVAGDEDLSTDTTSDGSMPAPPARRAASSAAAPAAADGLDLGSLIFGSESTRQLVKTIAGVAAGVAFGYLLGKNRAMERQLRHG